MTFTKFDRYFMMATLTFTDWCFTYGCRESELLVFRVYCHLNYEMIVSASWEMLLLLSRVTRECQNTRILTLQCLESVMTECLIRACLKWLLCVFFESSGQDAEGREQVEHPALPGWERTGVQSNWGQMPGECVRHILWPHKWFRPADYVCVADY